MKKVLFVLNDCMRKFSYERALGLHRALERRGEPFRLVIVRSDAYADFAPEHNRGEYNIYRLPDYGDFDGIFLDINSIFNADSGGGAAGIQYVVRAAAASGAPVISMANHIPGFRYVGIDNYAAMASVIRHLHRDRGLTDFWFALGPADNFENQARTQGLQDYCLANGLPCGEDRFYAESFILECGAHAFAALTARHGGRLPQAVICANDHIALGVRRAARAAGYDIPRDFLLTGFDNVDAAAPFLTTVDQLCWNMGECCVEAMDRIWRGEDVPERITTPTRLLARESTGQPPAARRTDHDALDQAGIASSATDFSYKLSAMQYRLPGCKSIEEICRALVDCISVLNCEGMDLVLDDRLFDPGRMRSIAEELAEEGYPETLEWVFTWTRDREPGFPRKRIGGSLSALGLSGDRANCLLAPLHFMERTVGYLCVRGCLDLMRIKGASSFVSTLTMALRNYFSARNMFYINRMLSGMSMKDGLTGLYNRLGYHELAYALFREAAARGGALAILFVDMDRLKSINDVYGHGAGDQAIRCVAEAIRQCAPGNAVPVRYGGDEFLILLPDAGEEAAQALVDSVKARISALAGQQGLCEIPGISTGFTVARPGGGRTLDEYVEEADARMYQEKKARKAGRTR